MYETIEKRLKDAIDSSSASSVQEVWLVFKKHFTKLNAENTPEIIDLGIQSELYLGSDYGPPCYYFAFHYKIEVNDGEQTDTHYELVYCEFDITNYKTLNDLENTSKDLWLSEYEENSVFRIIEEWEIFQLFKENMFKVNIYGTEV